MYHINNATTTEIPIIQALVEQIWRPTYQSLLTPDQIDYMIDMMYSTAALTKQLTELQHQYILLFDEQLPIGYASYSTTETAGVYKLHKIYLHQSYQGKGVGKLLMNSVIANVKALDAHILELDVNRDNQARLFYEKQGFTVYKEKDTHIGKGYMMLDYVMRKPLL
jgi:GNAT superfamily N-acetyltransferase